MTTVNTVPRKNLADCPACGGNGFLEKTGRCNRCAGSGKLVIRETAEGIKETMLLVE